MKIFNTHTGNTVEVKDDIGKILLNGHYKNQLKQVGETKTASQPVGVKKKQG